MNILELIGETAPCAYTSIILRLPQVRQLTVCRYETPPPLQKRIAIGDRENEIINVALDIRQKAKIPFWEAIFSACLVKGIFDESLLDATFYHLGPGNIEHMTFSELAAGALRDIASSDARNVAIGSHVELTTGELRHLVFLDFHCDVTEANEAMADSICRRVLPGGFALLASGDSYHATSTYLVSATERIRILGKSLLAAPIIDSTYIAHQLQQEFSSIRISKGGKSNMHPRVVRIFSPGDF